MRLISTHCRRFRQHADTQVEWGSGVTAVIADNEAGKTNLTVEAPLWAFFGMNAVRGTKESIRWHGAPARAGAEVDVVFELAGVRYSVERTESTATLRDLGTGKILAQGSAAVNGHMPKILGMGPEEFCSSFVCKQKDLARIASMLPVDRLKFVRKMLGVERIDEWLSACRKKKSALAQERAGMEAGLGERQPYVDEAVTAEDAEFEAGEAAGVAVEAKKAAQERLAVAQGVLATSAGLEQQHLRLTARLQEIDRDGVRLTKEIADLERQLGEHSAETEQQRTVLRRDADASDAKITRLGSVLDTARRASAWDGSALTAELDNAALIDMALAKAHLERTSVLADHRAMLKVHQRSVVDIEAKLAVFATLHADVPCPTCWRPMGAKQLATAAADARAQLVSAAGAVESMQQLVAAYSVPCQAEVEATAARVSATADIGRLRDAERLAHQRATEAIGLEMQLADVIGVRGQLERRLKTLGDVRASSHALLGERTRIARAAIDEVKADRAGTSALLEDLAFDQAAHKTTCDSAKAAQASFDATTVALARAEERQRGAAATLAATHKRLTEYDARAAKVREVADAHTLHEKVDARLSEFRTAVAGTIRPEMEELVSGFVNILTDGRHEAVQLTDDFAVTAYEGGVPMEVTSGGTEDLIALAMRLAISQMIAERAGHPLSLLVLDEPYASLDATRRAGMTALLRRLASTFSQIIVVSHVAETRDLADHAIELTYDVTAGRTRVV